MSDQTIINKLSKDAKEAAKTLDKQEVRYLVDTYYQLQDFRKASNNQARSMENEPNTAFLEIGTNFESMEKHVKGLLKKYAESQEVGRWMMSIDGVGETIAAGMMAYLDVNKTQTAGGFWKFCGLTPDVKWGKGEKRPWCAAAKVLCWKLGECIVKVSGKDTAFYGKLYRERKKYETAKNEAGEYAEQAKEILATRNIGKTTDAYKAYIQGKLPPAHIHARAKRYAVKMFLSHLYEVWYGLENHKPIAKPFAIEHLGHVHEIEPPNWNRKTFSVVLPIKEEPTPKIESAEVEPPKRKRGRPRKAQ